MSTPLNMPLTTVICILVVKVLIDEWLEMVCVISIDIVVVKGLAKIHMCICDTLQDYI